MVNTRAEECIPAQEGHERFCLEVYLTDVETCMFSQTSVSPTVILSFLDFEPLVFDISYGQPVQQRARRMRGSGLHYEPGRDAEQKEGELGGGRGIGTRSNADQNTNHGTHHHEHVGNKRSKQSTDMTTQHASYTDNEEGQLQRQPVSLSCRKGKSCIFTAHPADLSRAFQDPSALTLLVASKLSQRQAAIHGSCSIDMSTFGPNMELYRSLPRAVSSWGYRTGRVESKDPEGETVAMADLAISLSCLGATGYLIQPSPAVTAAASLDIPATGTTIASTAHSSAGRETLNRFPTVQSPLSAKRASRAENIQQDIPVARKPAICTRTTNHVKGAATSCGDRRRMSGSGFGGTLAYRDAWTCEYNPRDGSLREAAPRFTAQAAVDAAEAEAIEAAAAAAATVTAASGAGPAPSHDAIAAHSSRREDYEAVKEAAGTTALDGAPAQAETTGVDETPGILPTENTATGAEGFPPEGAGETERISTTSAPTTPGARERVGVSMSKSDQAGYLEDKRGLKMPLPATDGSVVDVNEAEGVATDEVAAPEGVALVGVVGGRKTTALTFPGNNHFVAAWRPGAVPLEYEDGIGLSGMASASSSRTVAPSRQGAPTAAKAGTKRVAVSARPKRSDWRRQGVSRKVNNDECSPSSRETTTTTTTTTNRKNRNPPQGRRREIPRRAWGAGPGTAANGTASVASISRGVSRLRSSAGDNRGVRSSERRKVPHPQRSSALPPRAAIGSAALQQFLPTWTSLVAEAAWLRGGESMGGDEGGVNGGDDDSVCAGHNLTIGSSATVATTAEQQYHPTASNAPLPSLDPRVERLLMEWLKTRIDRNVMVGLSSPADSLPPAAEDYGKNTGVDYQNSISRPPLSVVLQQRDHHQQQYQYQQQQQQHHHQDLTHRRASRRRSTAEFNDPRRPANGKGGEDDGTDGGVSACETTTRERLYNLFREALTTLLEEEKAASAPSGAVWGRHTPGTSSAETRVGWVAVVRRVSAFSEQTPTATALTGAQQPLPGDDAPATASKCNPTQQERREKTNRRPCGGDHPTKAKQEDSGTGGDGPQQRTRTGTGGSSSVVCVVEEPKLRPPLICIQPYRRLSPPPRLPPLRSWSRSPPISPLPRTLAASPPTAGISRPSSPRQQRTATTAAATAEPMPLPSATVPDCSQAPSSPRASRWLLDLNDGDRGYQSPRSTVSRFDVQDGRLSTDGGISGGTGKEGNGGVGRGIVEITATKNNAKSRPPSFAAFSDVDTNKGAGEIWKTDTWPPVAASDDGRVGSSPHTARRYGGMKGFEDEDDNPGEKGNGKEEEEEEEEESKLFLEEYESDFEAEED